MAELKSKFYTSIIKCCNFLQNPFLLLLRLYWGYSFAIAGWGKLNNIDTTAEFCSSISMPFPYLNVFLAAGTEFIGGICLLLGLFARLVSIPLAFTMIVALVTAHASDLTDFSLLLKSSPFSYLLVSLIICAFGPGKYSLDYLFGIEKSDPKKIW